MEYVTIMEAARRCGVSDKTIQRAIRAGTLLAHYPQPNRCEIMVSDLEVFRAGQRSGHIQIATEERLIALEVRIRHLEDLVVEMLSRQKGAEPKRTGKARERTTGLLPKQFVSLLVFARHHNVPETRALTHVDIGLLPAKQGEWMDHDGSTVMLALDAKGRAAFHQLYHGSPPFVECKQCPH